MALDTLQLSPVVINNDKLVQMAGSLMAKKQAEEKAYENDLINRMAKIDSSGMRSVDVEDFKKMYDEYVNFGSANLKNLNDPAIQVKLKNMENNLRGFTTQSKAEKEIDLKLLPYAANPEYADDSRNYVNSFMNMKTRDRVGQAFDYGKIMKIDDKDYISDVYKGFDGSVTEEIGTTTYKNTPELINKIKEKADRYIESTLKTPTGEKAFRQFSSKLEDPSNIPVAVAKFKQSLVDNFIARAEQSVTQDEPKNTTINFGYSADKEPVYKSRAELLYNLYKGNPDAIKSLMNSIPDAKIQNEAGFFRVTLPAYTNSQGVTFPEKKLNIDKKSPKGFLLEANKIYEILGERKGYKDIPYEEMAAFLSSPKNSKYIKKYDPSTFYRGKTTTKPSGNQGGSLLGGVVKIQK